MALLQKVGPRGEGRDGARARPLAPTPAWTLVSPTASAPDSGAGLTRRPQDPLSHVCLLPAASFPPLRVPPCVDPSGLGHAATIHSSIQGPPGFRNTDDELGRTLNWAEHKNAEI
jgi:hypothetical protein